MDESMVPMTTGQSEISMLVSEDHSSFQGSYSSRGLLPRERLAKDPVHKTKRSGTALLVLFKTKFVVINCSSNNNKKYTTFTATF